MELNHRTIFIVTIVMIVIFLTLHQISKAHSESHKATLSPLTSNTANKLVLKCATLYDTGRTTGNDLNLCDRIMDHVDNYCRDTYNELCFGTAWSNYDFHHKNIKCEYFEDNSKKCDTGNKNKDPKTKCEYFEDGSKRCATSNRND